MLLPLLQQVGMLGGGVPTSYTLTCDAGAYTYAGVSATLVPTHNYALICAVGAYTYSGISATLAPTYNYKLTCAVGVYIYAGVAATLSATHHYVLTCDTGAYAYAGSAAAFLHSANYSLSCDVGTNAYIGVDAVFNYYPGPQTATPVRRRRREKYGIRVDEIVEQVSELGIEEVQKTVARELALQAQEVANARTNYEIAKYMTQGAARADQLATLEDKMFAAEERMAQIQDEEDFILVLALTV